MSLFNFEKIEDTAKREIAEVFGKFETMVETLENSARSLRTKITENVSEIQRLASENDDHESHVNKALALKSKLEDLLK